MRRSQIGNRLDDARRLQCVTRRVEAAFLHRRASVSARSLPVMRCGCVCLCVSVSWRVALCGVMSVYCVLLLRAVCVCVCVCLS